MVWAWMLCLVENGRYYGLGMDALGMGCSQEWTSLWFGHGCFGNGMLSGMDVIMVWAMDALGMGCSQEWTSLWFGHGCFGNGMLSGMDVIMVWAWMLWERDALRNGRHMVWAMDALGMGCSQEWTSLWFGHGCFGNGMLSGMDVIMVWAWMLWEWDALRNGRHYGLGNGCFGNGMLSGMDVIMVWAWMLWEWDALRNGRHYGLGMDAKVIVRFRILSLFWFGHGCSGNRVLSDMDVIMVWAWMLSFSYALENGRVLGISAWQPLNFYPPKVWDKTNESTARETAGRNDDCI